MTDLNVKSVLHSQGNKITVNHVELMNVLLESLNTTEHASLVVLAPGQIPIKGNVLAFLMSQTLNKDLLSK